MSTEIRRRLKLLELLKAGKLSREELKFLEDEKLDELIDRVRAARAPHARAQVGRGPYLSLGVPPN